MEILTAESENTFNPFHATGLFLYPLKTSENPWFSDVFRRYGKRPVAWNGLHGFQITKLLLTSTNWNPLLIKNSNKKNQTRTVVKIEIASSIKLPGIHVDAFVRITYFLGYEERKVLIISFILSNFNWYPLVWSISSANPLFKVEYLQKRALRFLFNNYSISYEESLKIPRKATINVWNYRTFCIHLQTFQNINLIFVKELGTVQL